MKRAHVIDQLIQALILQDTNIQGCFRKSFGVQKDEWQKAWKAQTGLGHAATQTTFQHTHPFSIKNGLSKNSPLIFSSTSNIFFLVVSLI